MGSMKKGEKYEGYYYLKYFFSRWYFNRTLSIYTTHGQVIRPSLLYLLLKNDNLTSLLIAYPYPLCTIIWNLCYYENVAPKKNNFWLVQLLGAMC